MTSKAPIKRLSRRKALTLLGGAGVAARSPARRGRARPRCASKVKLTYWNWADNPAHQKISVDAVDMFNKSQSFIEVEVDATMAVMESRKKLVVAYRGRRARPTSS